jgi:hypothetical protein
MHDVNRARAMPQQPCIVATRSDCADAFLFKLDGDAMAEALASPSGSDTEMDDAEQQQRLPHQQDSGTPAGTSATASQEAAAEFNPLHVLTGGHAAGGFGLAWNGAAEGRLVTTGEDGVACVWDVAAGSPISSSDPQVSHAACLSRRRAGRVQASLGGWAMLRPGMRQPAPQTCSCRGRRARSPHVTRPAAAGLLQQHRRRPE